MSTLLNQAPHLHRAPIGGAGSTSNAGGPLNRKHNAPLRRLLVAALAGPILKVHNSQMQETPARSCAEAVLSQPIHVGAEKENGK